MLRSLLIALVAIVVIAGCVLILAAFKPARFTVRRSVIIQVKRDKVFDLINDLHRWQEWSADGTADSAVKRSYSGPQSGKGAIYEWAGAGSAGQGRMEIMESSSNAIRVQADWVKPFVARNINTFTFEPEGEATRVTWLLDGENVFMLKVMTVFVSVDRLMGSHFDLGLAGLKRAVEQS